MQSPKFREPPHRGQDARDPSGGVPVPESFVRAPRHIPVRGQTFRALRNRARTVFKNLVIVTKTRFLKKTRFLERTPDGVPSTAAMAAEPEQADVFESALTRMGDRERELVLLRLQQGYSFQKLGDRFDRSPDAARMAYHRALRRFRDEVRRLIADPGLTGSVTT